MDAVNCARPSTPLQFLETELSGKETQTRADSDCQGMDAFAYVDLYERELSKSLAQCCGEAPPRPTERLATLLRKAA